MKKVAQFFKVSENQFNKDVQNQALTANYNDIILPYRATTGSAGYDFYSPFAFILNSGETITVPTGIRAKIDEGYFLAIYPKSGLGFKYRLRLENTVGIIDSDYYFSSNEGHIMIKITNCSPDKTLTIEKGKAFAQGVFTEFFITVDDDANGVRDGGFGSTGK